MATGTHIWMIDVIDMTLENPDVIASVHLVAGNAPEDAAKKAMDFFGSQGTIDPTKKYHVNAVLIGPMPSTNKAIIVPSGAEASAILKSGEIVVPKR